MIASSKAAQRALIRRQKIASEPKSFKLEDFLFPEQLSFVKDAAPNKVAVCSRRSGKTIACAADLIDTALNHDGVNCLYITLSRATAKKIIWPELKKINKNYKLGGELNISELSLSFPNGSTIYLSGAKDTTEIEKFRGLALKLCYIDEAQSFRSFIKELIDDVLSPALMDYAGTLVLIGTPGPVPTGYFHDCAVKSNTWSKHKWTFWDNPFIIKKSGMPHKAMLDRELTRRGVPASDPSIQREWFGQWTLDSNSLLIRYDAAKNHYEQLPKISPRDKWNYIMGIDLGFKDADALAVIAWCESDPSTYLVEEVVTEKQGITELVEQIQILRAKYEISKMVIDEGGLGKKIAEEIRRRHAIPLEQADKVRKMENIGFLNDALRTGRFKAKSGSRFAQDAFIVEIDWDKSTPDKIKVSDRYHSDIIDAVLYSFKESPAFSYEPPVSKPKYGSKEWAEGQSQEMWENAQEHFQNQLEISQSWELPE